MLKATHVFVFHMVVVVGKALFLSISISLNFFSRILSVQFASTKGVIHIAHGLLS